MQLPKIRFHDRRGEYRGGELIGSTLRAPLRPACLSRCNGSIAMNAVVRYYVEPPSAGKDNLIPISRRGTRGESAITFVSRIHDPNFAIPSIVNCNPGSGLSPLGSCSFVSPWFRNSRAHSRFLSYDEHVIFPLPFFFSSVFFSKIRLEGRWVMEVFVHLWILMI